MELLGVKHEKSSPYYPESQGGFDRFHRSLKSLMKKYCLDSEEPGMKVYP